MKRIVQVCIVLLGKVVILAIFSTTLHILTQLPLLESYGVTYGVHVNLLLFIENYYTFFKSPTQAATLGRLF
mgnify:CR=1 FL=1